MQHYTCVMHLTVMIYAMFASQTQYNLPKITLQSTELCWICGLIRYKDMTDCAKFPTVGLISKSYLRLTSRMY